MSSLLEYFKHAELMGSRGWARMNGEPEPEGRDWDFIVFTDDPVLRARLRSILGEVGEIKEKDDRIWVRGPGNVDLNIWSTVGRNELLAAYAFRRVTGCTKKEFINYLELLRAYRSYS